MFRRTTLDVSFQGVSKLFAAVYEPDDIEEMLIMRNQEEDIIYQE